MKSKKLVVVVMAVMEPAAKTHCESLKASPVKVPGVPAKSLIVFCLPTNFNKFLTSWWVNGNTHLLKPSRNQRKKGPLKLYREDIKKENVKYLIPRNWNWGVKNYAWESKKDGENTVQETDGEQKERGKDRRGHGTKEIIKWEQVSKNGHWRLDMLWWWSSRS